MTKAAAAVLVLTTLTGCSSLTTQLTSELKTEEQVAAVCADPQMTAVSVRTRYKTDMASLLEAFLGFSDQGSDQAPTLIQLVETTRRDLNAALLTLSNDPEPKRYIDLRAQIRQVSNEARYISTQVRNIRASIKTATSDAMNAKAGTGTDLPTYFYNLAYVVAPAIQDDALQIQSDLLALTNDVALLQSAFANTANLSPDAKKAISVLQVDIQLIQAATSRFAQAFNLILTQQAATPGIVLTATEVAELNAIFEDLVSYETAHLIVMQLTRGTRALEFKLDQVDDKTWFIISLLAVTSSNLSSHFAEEISQDFVTKPSQYQVTNALVHGLVIASCEELNEDASAGPTNSQRARTLLQPFYREIIREAKIDHPTPDEVDPAIAHLISANSQMELIRSPQLQGARVHNMLSDQTVLVSTVSLGQLHQTSTLERCFAQHRAETMMGLKNQACDYNK